MRLRALRTGLVYAALGLVLASRLSVADGAEAASDGTLGLDEVLRSVDEAYPLLLAAQADRRAFEGRLRSARGSFFTTRP